jgi:transcriptional regulator with XRE-family HTH domain
VEEKPAGAAPWDAFGNYLRNQRQLAQLSLRQLADLTKVSNPYLSQIERGLHRPSIAIIKSLAEALNLSTKDLLAHAADIAADEEATTTTEGAIRNDPLLNAAQKGALLAVYRSMVDGDTADTRDTSGAATDGSAAGTDETDEDPAPPGKGPKKAPGTRTRARSAPPSQPRSGTRSTRNPTNDML